VPHASTSTDKSSDPERRAQILDCAERLLSHYGPAKTTIGDIAREAGIGIGSVYLEFESKDEIIGELAGRRHQRVLEAMRAAAQRGSYAERLTRALEARIHALFELSGQGVHACDLVFCKSMPVKVAYGRFREEELKLVAELLREGTRGGELDVKQPKRAAELVQRAYASFSPPWLFEQERQEVLACVRAMNELLLKGVLRRR
jgi:AcrR family transcriptional regulator